jgi:hypothetical protein
MPHWKRLVVVATVVSLGATIPVVGVQASSSTVVSFNESPGCGGSDGVGGPFASQAFAGLTMPDSEPVLGPWGDFYGRTIAEVKANLVSVEMPMPAAGYAPFTVRVNKRVEPALRRVIANLKAEEAKGNYYVIHRYETWSFSARVVPPRRNMAFHAMGAAIDINAPANPYSSTNRLVTDIPAWFVKAWTDAGWCWGGSWVDIKDPMHFSYPGPLLDPSYQPQPPVAPRTAAASFTRALTFTTALGPAPDGAVSFVTDVDRDGAPDPVQVRRFTGTGSLFVEAAQAAHGFETCWWSGPTSTSAIPGATVLLADGTGRGRPDLWEVDGSTGQLSVRIHTFASGFAGVLPAVSTPIPWTEGTTLLVGDHNRDRQADLYVVRPGDQATLEVWAGPDFVNKMLEVTLSNPVVATWRFALGDRDLDGVPDLYALSPDNPAQLVVVPGTADFTTSPQTVTTGIPATEGAFQVGDFDGDGRDDIYLYQPNGTITVYLGGERGATPDTTLTYWFYENHNRHWTWAANCPAGPGSPTPTIAPIPPTASTPPAAPSAPQLVSGNRTVKVSWAAPSDGGAAITDYVIQYRRKGTTTWATFNDGVSTVLHTHVGGLSNGVPYQFRVAARNPAGSGAYSTVSQATPGSSTTTSAPTQSVDSSSVAALLAGTQPLRRGSSGTAVRELQAFLGLQGYQVGTADGVFGSLTETALKAFQRAQGLTADGVAGAATRNAIRALAQ